MSSGSLASGLGSLWAAVAGSASRIRKEFLTMGAVPLEIVNLLKC